MKREGASRSTKIVATLGPSTSGAEILNRLIVAGTDVFRLNFSHASASHHRALARLVRKVASGCDRTVAIMCDLQGPKIRIGQFENKKVWLKQDEIFSLEPGCRWGNEARVGVEYEELAGDSPPGSVLLLDDGKIVLDVLSNVGGIVRTRVRHGGPLADNKGINREGGGISASALTAKDIEDIQVAAEIEADFLAVSFPKSAADIRAARDHLRRYGGRASLIAKIERAEAVHADALLDIIRAADGIMVARGDLAVEVGAAAIPAIQKRMIRLATVNNKFSIVATQMMESMIQNPVPTRAEVSDVANAVLDGTDAVMLSAESAVGEYPVEAVEVMSRVCLEAEKSQVTKWDQDLFESASGQIDRSVAMAGLFTAHLLNADAIATLTESGATALAMSRVTGDIPIYALASHSETRTRCAIFRGVHPIPLDSQSRSRDDLLLDAEAVLVEQKIAVEGDVVVLTIGEPLGEPGGTNTMKVIRVRGSPKRILQKL